VIRGPLIAVAILFGLLGLLLVGSPEGGSDIGTYFLVMAGICFFGARKIGRVTPPRPEPFVDNGLDRASHEPDL
jgi:hypothetical protein